MWKVKYFGLDELHQSLGGLQEKMDPEILEFKISSCQSLDIS